MAAATASAAAAEATAASLRTDVAAAMSEAAIARSDAATSVASNALLAEIMDKPATVFLVNVAVQILRAATGAPLAVQAPGETRRRSTFHRDAARSSQHPSRVAILALSNLLDMPPAVMDGLVDTRNDLIHPVTTGDDLQDDDVPMAPDDLAKAADTAMRMLELSPGLQRRQLGLDAALIIRNYSSIDAEFIKNSKPGLYTYVTI